MQWSRAEAAAMGGAGVRIQRHPGESRQKLCLKILMYPEKRRLPKQKQIV